MFHLRCLVVAFVLDILSSWLSLVFQSLFCKKKNNPEMCTYSESLTNKSKWNFYKIRFDLNEDKNMKCLINSQYEIAYMVEYIK